MIYLHKFLPLLVSPLFLAGYLILVGFLLRSRKLGFVGLTFLVFCSLPIVSKNCIRYLEKDYDPIDVSEVNVTQAIVVLSGIVRTVSVGDNYVYEWGEGSDRIFGGIDLAENKKAPFLILTRGQMPWSTGKPEAEHLREVAIKYGIPAENILLTERVENTDQEAVATKKLIGLDNTMITLVTSAFHMPRAQLVFEAAGFKVVPFPVDFRRSENRLSVLDFIPSAGALADFSFFIREMIGRIYYSYKY
jgi:uncharacterized SAM-binding protein YcdF (DUF218 family)